MLDEILKFKTIFNQEELHFIMVLWTNNLFISSYRRCINLHDKYLPLMFDATCDITVAIKLGLISDGFNVISNNL